LLLLHCSTLTALLLLHCCPSHSAHTPRPQTFDAPVAQLCLPCKPGITTAGAGAKLAAECNQVLPGYGISEVRNVTGPQSIPALPQNTTTGLPEASLCRVGFYGSGGFCAECPGRTATRETGAKTVESCMVPPGYYLPATGGSMTPCGAGTFREGWVMFSDPKAVACRPCGDGINSEARDLDENPLVANGTLARATSFSCCESLGASLAGWLPCADSVVCAWHGVSNLASLLTHCLLPPLLLHVRAVIEAGQGMIASGRNTFVGRDCPNNTYGAAGRVYGWASAPCKPCPRNMITDGLSRVNTSDACINPGG
jgi:hypothetical protein